MQYDWYETPNTITIVFYKPPKYSSYVIQKQSVIFNDTVIMLYKEIYNYQLNNSAINQTKNLLKRVSIDSNKSLHYILNMGCFSNNSATNANSNIISEENTCKAELILYKLVPERWGRLTLEPKAFVPHQFDIEYEEEPEEQNLENWIYELYEKGNNDVKKAMNKSFIESGGKEISSNWDNVKTNNHGKEKDNK